MKTEQPDILSQIGRRDGFKVPEGYFESFNKRMLESLPEPKLTPQLKPGTWVRIRPYVYLAAMFAGIWCTMRIFNDLSGQGSRQGQMQAIVNGMQDEDNIDELMTQGSLSDYDILTYQDSTQSSFEYIQPDTDK